MAAPIRTGAQIAESYRLRREAAEELYEALEDALKLILGDIKGDSQRKGIISAGVAALAKADGDSAHQETQG